MIHIYRISTAFFLCSSLFLSAMEPYEMIRRSELKETAARDFQKKSSKESARKVPDAIKSEIAHKEQMHATEKKTRQLSLEKTKPTRAQELNIHRELKEQDQPAIQPINLSPQTNTTIDTSSLTPIDSSLQLDIQTKNESNKNTTTTLVKNYGGGESQILDLAQEKVQSEYENALQKAIASSVIDTPIQSHGIDEFLDEHIQHAAHELLHITPTQTPSKTPSNLPLQMRKIAEQIRKYNSIKNYSNMHDMAEFIQTMHNFLKESKLVMLSETILKNMAQAYTTASKLSYELTEQKRLFTINAIPLHVRQIFDSSLEAYNNIALIQNTNVMMKTIYETNGSIEKIINTMDTSFTNIAEDEQDGLQILFMTFVLIFKTSIAATSMVINDANQRYKIIEPLIIMPIF